MPQLDIYSVANQLFWGSLFFGGFYALLVFFFIPAFFSSLYARRAFLADLSSSTFELLGLAFAAHLLVSVSIEEIEKGLAILADQLIYTRIVNLAVCETAFEFEFAQLFEDEEYDPQENG